MGRRAEMASWRKLRCSQGGRSSQRWSLRTPGQPKPKSWQRSECKGRRSEDARASDSQGHSEEVERGQLRSRQQALPRPEASALRCRK